MLLHHSLLKMHIKSSLFCQSGVGQRVNNTVAGADTVSSLRKDVWVVIITNKSKNIHYHVKVALASGFVFNGAKIHIAKVTKKSFTDRPNKTACEITNVLTDIVDLVETELTKDRKVRVTMLYAKRSIYVLYSLYFCYTEFYMLRVAEWELYLPPPA